MSPPTHKLTAEQRAIRDECIEVCKKTLKQTMDFVSAFRQLHDDKLYLETHSRWEDFCQEKLGITRSYANRLMAASDARDSLPPSLASQIVNESQARAVAKVPEKNRAEVIREASKTGAITATTIRDAAAQMVPMAPRVNPIESGKVAKTIVKQPHVELDEKRYPIPGDIVELWARRQELEDLKSRVSAIKCQIEKSLGADDPLYRGIRNSIIMELTGIHYQISRNKPYAVCTDCQGHPELNKGCKLCYRTGLIGKEAYESVTAKEIRQIRERGVAMRQ